MKDRLRTGLLLIALGVALPALAWLSCLFIPELDGQRFYVQSYRIGLVLQPSGYLLLAGIVVLVIDYIARIQGPNP